MTQPAPLRVAVAGLRRGLTFLRLFRAMPDIQVFALIDPDPSARSNARSLVNGPAPKEVNYLSDLLDSGDPPDFVVLATPPVGRVADAEIALARGVSVLSEIPAVLTREEAERLISAVEASSATYMMAENCCYWGFVQSAIAMRKSGQFGSIFYSEAEMMQDMRPILRDEKGVPTWRYDRKDSITYCSHSLGPLIRIAGSYPTEVVCQGASGHFEPGMAEVQTALIRLDNGGLIRLTISLLNNHWHGHRFALFGTKASLDTGWVWQDQPKYWTEDVPNLVEPIRLSIGPDVPSVPPVARTTGEAAMNWLMVRDFVSSLRNGTPPPVDVYDALMFSVPGICAAESSTAGGQTVAVPQYHLRRGN